MSELDLAKKLFGTSNRNTGYSSAPSRIQNQGVTTTVGTSSTRYGTVQAIGDNNYLTILLDGSDEPIKAYCETPVVVGQRVSVVIGNNTITVIALQSFVEQVQQNQEQTNTKFQEIQQQGEELAASVAEDIQQVQDSVDAATSAANAAKESAEAASEAASAASDKADAASSKADELSSSLGELSGKVDSVETTVNGVESDVSELTTTVTATQETAQSALTAATSAQQDITGFKTTVSQTYETKADADAAMAQEVLDRNSAISQSATEIKQEVSQNYVSNETGETLATKAEVTQSANQIKQEVSQNYQVKGDYATSGELDDAIAKEVSDRNSAITQSATEIKQEVSENYVNNETGATLATKTELTTAIDGVTSTVSQNYVNKNDASKTYATKTEVTQTKDSILQSVSDSYQVKGDYATADDIDSAIAAEVVNRNAAIETKANQITQTVSETYQSKTDAGTMESSLQAQIKTQADRITQEVSDRKTAVSGAITESKTYTDTTAEGLTTSITQSVMNEVGETYTKQADFELTLDGFSAEFTTAIGEVEDKAEAAQSTADTAKSTADSAASTANTAKSTADTANKTATTASTNASSALSTANTAKDTADKASSAASAAQSTASSASTAANEAKSTASAAQSAASTAQSTANTAKTTADNASKAASTAQSTANTANTTANQAKTAASNAQTTANSAQTAANEAAKTATNFIAYTASTGSLSLGNKIDSLNKNELVLSPSIIEMKEDAQTVASFSGEKGIMLGNVSKGAVSCFTNTKMGIYAPSGVLPSNPDLDYFLESPRFEVDVSDAGTSIDGYVTSMFGNVQFMSLSSDGGMDIANLEINSPGDIYIGNLNTSSHVYIPRNTYIEGYTSISGDDLVLDVNKIEKPAITIGHDGENMNFTFANTDQVFPANRTVGQSGPTSNEGTTYFYRSGNYAYLRIPRGTDLTEDTVAVEVSAYSRVQGLNDTNYAMGIDITHTYGGATGTFLSDIGGPVISSGTAADSYFSGNYITPVIINLPRAKRTVSQTYDLYRFSVVGRTSNGSGTLGYWYMTARLL